MDRPGRSFERVFGTPSTFPSMRRSLPMSNPPMTRLRTPVQASQQSFRHTDPPGIAKSWLHQQNRTFESNGASGEPSQLMYQYQSSPKPVPPGQNNYNQPYSGHTLPPRPPMFQQPFQIPPEQVSYMLDPTDEVSPQHSPITNSVSDRCWASEDLSLVRESRDRNSSRRNWQPVASGQLAAPSPYMMQRRQPPVGVPSGVPMPGLGNSPPPYPQDRPSLHLGRNRPLDPYEIELRIRGQEKQRRYRDDLLQQAEEDKKRKAAERVKQAEEDRRNEIRNVEHTKQEQLAIKEQKRKNAEKELLKERRKQEAADEIQRAAAEARKKKAQQEMEVKRLQKQMEEVTLKAIAPTRRVIEETATIEQLSERPKSVKRISTATRQPTATRQSTATRQLTATRQPTAKPRTVHQSQSNPKQVSHDAMIATHPIPQMTLSHHAQESQSLDNIQWQSTQQLLTLSQAQPPDCSSERASPDIRTFLKHFNTAVEALTSRQSTTYEGFLYDLQTLSYHCRYRPTREAFNQYMAEEQNIKAVAKEDPARISRSKKKKRRKHSDLSMFNLMETKNRSFFPTYSSPDECEEAVVPPARPTLLSTDLELDAPEVNWQSDDPEFHENSPAHSNSRPRTYVVETVVTDLGHFEEELISSSLSPYALKEDEPSKSPAISLHSDIGASDHDIDEDFVSVVSERKQDDADEDEQLRRSNSSESESVQTITTSLLSSRSRHTSASSSISATTKIQDQVASDSESETGDKCTSDTNQEDPCLTSQERLNSPNSSINEPSPSDPRPIDRGNTKRNHELQKSSKSRMRKENLAKRMTSEKSARRMTNLALTKAKRPFY